MMERNEVVYRGTLVVVITERTVSYLTSKTSKTGLIFREQEKSGCLPLLVLLDCVLGHLSELHVCKLYLVTTLL